MDAQQPPTLQQAMQRIQQLEGQVQQLEGQVQQQQELIAELLQQQQQPEVEEEDVNDEEEEEGDPMVMDDDMMHACNPGDGDEVVEFIEAGKNVNCIHEHTGSTPLMFALYAGHVSLASKLLEMGADLSIIDYDGANILHDAANGGVDCVNLVFDHIAIDVNSTNNSGSTPIMLTRNIDVAKLLIENGANLFLKDEDGDSALDKEFGPAALQHAKDLIWASVRPLLRLSNSCTSDVVPVDPSIVIPTSVISVFGNSDITRHIAGFVKRRDIISIDPDDDEEKEPDEVKRRVEASLASAIESIKRARTK
jgi:hypothetical protein